MNDDIARRVDRLTSAERARRVREQHRRFLPDSDLPAHETDCPRRGVAVITANGGDGEYTVTEQWWDAGTSTWTNAAEPLGHVAASARDFRGRDSGKVNDSVAFWEQRAKDGSLELVIDVDRPPSGSGYAGADLALLFRVNVGDDGSVVLNHGDWRDRAIWISVSIDAGGDNSFTAHGVRSDSDYMGVVQEFDGGDTDYILFTMAVGGSYGDFKVHVDGTDDGTLKFTSYNFAAGPDAYTAVIWARASRVITVPTHNIT